MLWHTWKMSYRMMGRPTARYGELSLDYKHVLGQLWKANAGRSMGRLYDPESPITVEVDDQGRPTALVWQSVAGADQPHLLHDSDAHGAAGGLSRRSGRRLVPAAGDKLVVGHRGQSAAHPPRGGVEAYLVAGVVEQG